MPAYQGNQPYIFLSFAQKDKELADYVVDYLQGYNFNVWFDEGIHTETPWKDVIIDKITNCSVMVFLATQNSLASEWCANELRFAKEKGKKFINVVIGEPTIPDWFKLSYADYQFLYEKNFPNREAMMVKLVKELIHHAMNTNKPTDTPKDTTNDTPKPSPTEGLKFTIFADTATVTSYKGTDTKVIIPATITYNGKTYKVTAIGEWAFHGCENITSVTIPDSVTSIGKWAFRTCKNLTAITIPESVTSIGKWAFNGCSSLTSIEVDENNQNYKSIDGNLYTKDGTILIQYAIGKTATSFTIPNSVTSIGINAFARCKNLTSITIPDSVTSIGEGVFECCSSLTSITIPNSVTTIGEQAFWECSLTSVAIPESVTSIGKSAFSWCIKLTSITIPNSVTSIGAYAFEHCKKLTIYCEAKSKPSNWHTYWNPDKRPVVWGCEISKLISDNGLKFTVTDGTATVIGYKGNDTNVIIPATIIRDGKTYKVTAISEYAFYECDSLTSITIPDSVTSIGREAFSWCKKLTSITIPNSVKSIRVRSFVFCSSLTSITIPDSVTSIGRDAFEGCSGLTSITIPNSVTSIGDSAFFWCSGLTIYCEAKSKPERWHFGWNPHNRPVVWGYGSSSPKEDEVCESSKPSTDSTTTPKPSPTKGLKFTVTDGTASVDRYKGTDTKVIIPATIIRNGKTYKVTSVGKEAFYKCTTNITSITIPDSVTTIGDLAFKGCENLTSITIPESVTSIGERAFWGCSSLTSITIPDSVTTIGKGAFEDCKNLTSITIPKSVTSIGDSAFSWCENITSINVDKNNSHYKSIDGNLYTKDGSTLIQYAIGKTATSFTIPDSVTSIRYSAFAHCENLTSITIPESVTSIGEQAFEGCKNLTSITIPNSVTSIGVRAFMSCYSLTSITIPNSVTSIGAGAFAWCKNLTSISIPNSVRSIGDQAFSGCENLTSITIPDSVRSIGESAFEGCSSLTSITIPDSVTSIGEGAFGWCSSLTSITIPDSVTSIGSGAFDSCCGLTSITIPNSVTSIGEDAFYECKNLTIYCEAKSKPSNWHAKWNPDKRPVVWRHKIN